MEHVISPPALALSIMFTNWSSNFVGHGPHSSSQWGIIQYAILKGSKLHHLGRLLSGCWRNQRNEQFHTIRLNKWSSNSGFP